MPPTSSVKMTPPTFCKRHPFYSWRRQKTSGAIIFSLLTLLGWELPSLLLAGVAGSKAILTSSVQRRLEHLTTSGVMLQGIRLGTIREDAGELAYKQQTHPDQGPLQLDPGLPLLAGLLLLLDNFLPPPLIVLEDGGWP